MRRPPSIGAEPGRLSLSAEKPFANDCVDSGGEFADDLGFSGIFFRISSYKSRRKSSLKRPNVEHAAAKPAKLFWSTAN